MICLAVAGAVAGVGLGLLFFRGDVSEPSCSSVTSTGDDGDGNGGTNTRAFDVPKALNE
jgi:hypothetical protein